MGFPSLQHTDDSRRSAIRRSIDADSTLRAIKSVPMDATVSDLSETGVSVRVNAQLSVGTAISIGLPGIGAYPATIVRVAEDVYGCQFDRPIPPSAVATAFAATVVYVGGARPDDDIEPEPQRWPRPVRLAAYAFGAAVPWAIILTLLR